MNLVNDINLEFSELRGKAHLLNQSADIIHRVVGSGIQFVNVQGSSFIEGSTGFTLSASFYIFCLIETVDGLGEDTRASGFTYTSGTAKQECLSQMVVFDGVFQRIGNRSLPHYRIKGLRAVFT